MFNPIGWLINRFTQKEKTMSTVQQIVEVTRKVLGVVTVAVALAEDTLDPSTSGATKKAKVVADIQNVMAEVAREVGVPSLLMGLLTNEAVLGMFVDAVVNAANAAGVFGQPSTPSTPSA